MVDISINLGIHVCTHQSISFIVIHNNTLLHTNIHALLYWRTLMDSPHFSCTRRSWPKKQYACKNEEKNDWFVVLQAYSIIFFLYSPLSPAIPPPPTHQTPTWKGKANINRSLRARDPHRHCRRRPWGWGSGSIYQTVPDPESSMNHLYVHT